MELICMVELLDSIAKEVYRPTNGFILSSLMAPCRKQGQGNGKGSNIFVNFEM